VNLPNAITVARIAATPLIAWLPLVDSWPMRLLAFVLFIAAAVTDYVDGMLARTRNLVTDLGRLLDPLADKLLLVATFVPMWLLQRPLRDGRALPLDTPFATALDQERWFPFVTPLGLVPLPLWVILVVVGREALMTVFRQTAAKRGLIISAIGPAKLKTIFQQIWVGAAYFWFFACTLAASRGWDNAAWAAFANVNGVIGVVSMTVAVGLTLYSLGLYVRRYGYILFRREKARAEVTGSRNE
jgi:CDP-diacylglycerol---glycerol-3-phosphate 3-phosphatidyltransferase